MGKMPLYTMLQKARSMGGWTMVAQLEAMPREPAALLEGRLCAEGRQHRTAAAPDRTAGLHSSWYPLCCRHRHLCGALWRGAAAGSLRRWTLWLQPLCSLQSCWA